MNEIIVNVQRFGMPASVFLAAVTISLQYSIDLVADKYGPQVKVFWRAAKIMTMSV